MIQVVIDEKLNSVKREKLAAQEAAKGDKPKKVDILV